MIMQLPPGVAAASVAAFSLAGSKPVLQAELFAVRGGTLASGLRIHLNRCIADIRGALELSAARTRAAAAAAAAASAAGAAVAPASAASPSTSAPSSSAAPASSTSPTSYAWPPRNPAANTHQPPAPDLQLI
ncbi:hypothetical protein DUNSADRAFT_16167 [Dunaliella salina]|uniref:Encoded protein n=1 Tax=Dunaliella salina TaxID=3046 RepID=A0ABQ7G479_DUNSA|nr:hypothetical protein DUNSADRAFT_16167 [Dunaliella salina]|eukprot:KAF5829382.1 hypothetical protein DUNSADRAFT_16167 [Dunaliella salina]